MKRLLLPLMLLLVTGCASVRIHKELDVKAYPAGEQQYGTPVLVTYGPNDVGYATIFETSLNDANIPVGATLACNVVVPSGKVILLEGTLLSKAPFFMLANTRLGLIPVHAVDDQIEYCLISWLEMK